MTKKIATRALNETFLNEFKNGKLKSLLSVIKDDPNLIMCFRGNKTSVYYKSSLILEINQSPSEKSLSFTKVSKDYYPEYDIIMPCLSWDENEWVTYFQRAKYKIDMHCIKKNSLEKEIQQVIFRENSCNSNSAKTDYFIFDIEYTQTKHEEGRFDALAVLWPSKNRSMGKDLRLAFIEVKVGEGAICNKSGVFEHYKSVANFLNSINNNEDRDLFFKDMENVIRQQRDLGLLQIFTSEGKDNPHEITLSQNLTNKDKKPQLIFALANYSPNAKCLESELKSIENFNNNSKEPIPFELLFATSSCMGYGLYKKCMFNLEEIREKLKYEV